MAIPAFVAPSGALPPGEHEATLKEISSALTWNYSRRVIYSGLEFVVNELTAHSVDVIWVDGSFVTNKDRPRDVDVAYEVPSGGDPDGWGLLSPARHNDLKRYQRVDLYAYWPGQPQIKEFFSTDRNGAPKGIIRLVAAAA